MKNRLIAAITLVVLTVGLTSCYTSRKYGCPGNPSASYKFRG